MESRQCPQCGRTLEKEEAVCRACGKEVNEQEKPLSQQEKRGRKNLSALIILFLVILLGLSLLMATGLIPNPLRTGLTAAIVNGEKISVAELDQKMVTFKKLHGKNARLDTSSPEGKAALADIRKDILQAMIHERILITEAKKEGLTPSRQEIAERINAIKRGMKFSEKDFDDFLKNHSMDLAAFEKRVVRDLLISKLLARGKEKGLTKEAWVQGLMARAKVEILAP